MDLPEAYLERMKGLLGDEYGAFLSSMEEPAVRSLKVNSLKSPEDFDINDHFSCEGSVEWEEGALYLAPGERPGLNPLHEAGAYYIQEASAMAAVPELDVKPGMRVLDLCASPGGKTVQIAMRLEGKGLLISNEYVPSRAATLSQNVERMGITNACAVNSSPEEIAEVFPSFFDRVLVDAPCSGEGMFRKNPEAIGEWSPENVKMCADRQKKILASAERALRPGGKLVYSTCTFESEEDGEQADWIADSLGLIPGARKMYMPHTCRGEGQFVSSFTKKGDENAAAFRPSSIMGGNPEVIRQARKLLEECLKRELPEGNYICSANMRHVCLSPVSPGALRGLKVVRQGLPLADTDRFGRITLSHSLAMALKPGDVRMHYEMNEDEARSFLRGDVLRNVTLVGEGPVLMCFCGFSMGWGVNKGNIIKNHLPKGLRK